MTLGVPKHVVAAILIGGDPNALSIRPTGIVTEEARSYNLKIILIKKDSNDKPSLAWNASFLKLISNIETYLFACQSQE